MTKTARMGQSRVTASEKGPRGNLASAPKNLQVRTFCEPKMRSLGMLAMLPSASTLLSVKMCDMSGMTGTISMLFGAKNFVRFCITVSVSPMNTRA